MNSRRSNAGATLLEAMVSLLIMSIAVIAVVLFEGNALRGTEEHRDRDLAIRKAVQIMNELRAFVEGGDETALFTLDDLDDGVGRSAFLTIDPRVTMRGLKGVEGDPGDPVSGNLKLMSGEWRYSRTISVRSPGTDEAAVSSSLRYVTVRVFREGEPDQPKGRVIAEVSGVIQTISTCFAPAQTYDVYLLAIENVPTTWVSHSQVRPILEGAAADLEAGNPGLRIRFHWITKLAYGRDTEYLPYVNRERFTTDPIPGVYFYPGRLPGGLGQDYYFSPNRMGARMNRDGRGILNDYSETENPYPYALADQFNHAMRYPDELAWYEARQEAQLDGFEEPTLRLLLEDMHQRPRKYKNALVVNLHGELLPLPPVRNYSDAAKDPEEHPGVRVVTHPERLRYENRDHVVLRVYSYLSELPPDMGRQWADESGPPRVDLTLSLPQLSDPSAVHSIQAIYAGDYAKDPSGMWRPESYSRGNPLAGSVGVRDQMSAVIEKSRSGKGIVIQLRNSPLLCDTACGPVEPPVFDLDDVFDEEAEPCLPQGLPSGLAWDDPLEIGAAYDYRLYGQQYIPSPAGSADHSFRSGDFRDLTHYGWGPKNTARWIVTLRPGVLPSGSRLTVETRVGSQDEESGVAYPPAKRRKPANLSRTYAWIGVDPPMSEQFQFLGDPRHWPYEGTDKTPSTRGRFNRYFRFLNADWPGFERDGSGTTNGWGGDESYREMSRDLGIDTDVPALFRIYRTALGRTGAIFTGVTNPSFYYFGLGGEIGPQTTLGYGDGIPCSAYPYLGTGGSIRANELGGRRNNPGGAKRREDRGGRIIASAKRGEWYAKPWLGELWPDALYAHYWKDRGDGKPRGNLPAGAEGFLRSFYYDVQDHTYDPQNGESGKSQEFFDPFYWDRDKKLGYYGAGSFFNATGPRGTGPVSHRSTSNTFAVLNDQTERGDFLYESFRYPLLSVVASTMPLYLDSGSFFPAEWKNEYYRAERGKATPMFDFYTQDQGRGSTLFFCEQAGEGGFSGVLGGLTASGQSGTQYQARYALMTALAGHLISGENSILPEDHRIHQLPLVQLTHPSCYQEYRNPDSITIDWEVAWKRWGNRDYTHVSWEEIDPLQFVILYSPDGGTTWHYLNDSAPAPPGGPHSSEYLESDVQTATWFVDRLSFPEGNYLIRVEGWREGYGLHYSYHQQRIYIHRPDSKPSPEN